MTPDYSRDHTELDSALASIERSAARLADGQERVAAFRHAAVTSLQPADYITERMEVRHGIAVMCVVPGPKLAAFLMELEGGV